MINKKPIENFLDGFDYAELKQGLRVTQSPIGERYRQIRDVLTERAGAGNGLIFCERWEHYFLFSGFQFSAWHMILNTVQFVKRFKSV